LGCVHVLHDFTQNTDELIARLAKADLSAMPKYTGTPETEDNLGAWLHGREASYKVAQLGSAERQSGSCGSAPGLDGIRWIAHHVAGIPGRKSVIWLSGGFDAPVGTMGPRGAESPVLIPQNCFAAETSAVRAANAANIAVYSTDVRGIVAPLPGGGGLLPGTASRAVILLEQAKMLAFLGGVEQVRAVMAETSDRTGGVPSPKPTIFSARSARRSMRRGRRTCSASMPIRRPRRTATGGCA
jgi:hypothetical protein